MAGPDQSRQSTLPISLELAQDLEVHLFFPLAPSSQRVQASYTDAAGSHELVIDTRQALAGLHMGDAARKR